MQCNPEDIPENIRKLRLQLGYSQHTVARALGISQNSYCKIELGYSKLTVNKLFNIAEVFKLPIQDFFLNPRYWAVDTFKANFR